MEGAAAVGAAAASEAADDPAEATGSHNLAMSPVTADSMLG